jgi:luciferase family oxidoreductase group 1
MPRPLLSILDLATVPEGATSRDALLVTEAVAGFADASGFHRFWVAEHHNLEGVASTHPAVLIAHLAGRTERIRLGSGGVMLPNHTPLDVAEQFAMLEALHPGRIDLGIGRAPGTDPRTAAMLRNNPARDPLDDFPKHVIQVMGLLGDPRGQSGMWDRYRATPRAISSPVVVLLGSSGYSAQLAGALGIPFAYAHHFETGHTAHAVDSYRASFTPSPRCAAPHVIVTVAAFAADDEEIAVRLAAPALLRRFGLRTGRRFPLLSPDAAMGHPDYGQAAAMPTNRIVGSIEVVASGLERLAGELEADELMLYSPTYTLDERLASLERIAAAWHQTSI